MYPFSLQAIHFSLDSLFLQPSRCVSVARGLWKEEEIWDLNNYIRTWSCSNWKRPVGREMDSLQPEIAVSVFCAWVRIWKGLSNYWGRSLILFLHFCNILRYSIPQRSSSCYLLNSNVYKKVHRRIKIRILNESHFEKGILCMIKEFLDIMRFWERRLVEFKNTIYLLICWALWRHRTLDWNRLYWQYIFDFDQSPFSNPWDVELF